MEQERKTGSGIRTALASLRVQIVVLLVLCWLIPALVLSVFIQSSLIPALRSKTASALDADAEHAWTLACQNIDGVIAQARDAGLKICTLGPRILRCETAPLAGLTAVMYALGEL